MLRNVLFRGAVTVPRGNLAVGCYRLSDCVNFSRQYSSSTSEDQNQRIQKFVDPQVQSLLIQLTGQDLKRIFRKRKIGQKLMEPKYSFMTEEQLENTIQEARDRADDLIRMPPVLPPRKPVEKILAFDPRIQGYDDSVYIMTEITMNMKDKDRLIVVRDLDGTLRYATADERTKALNIYFPKVGREFRVPKMFEDRQVMRSVLDRASEEDNTYEFILDRACLQFEPDDPEYFRVVETTYDHVDQSRQYDLLKSTRHYGPLVFYLTRTRRMENLLLFNIQHERISADAAPLVSLFHLIFPESKSRAALSESSDEIDKIRKYIQLDSVKRSELELALNAYLEITKNREEVETGLERAHGV